MKIIVVLLLVLGSSPVFAGKTVTVSARDDAAQSGLLVEATNAQAVALLFPGGSGYINLRDDGTFTKKKYNFLVRSHEYFTVNNIHVVIMDSPSDHQNDRGMKYGFRASEEHSRDIAAMVDAMKKRFNLPVWLIGTSRGTESVANAMVQLNGKIDGAVLTASMTEFNDKGPAVFEFDLAKVSIPVLVAHHQEDKCWVTQPEGVQQIGDALTASRRVKVLMFKGGDEPESDDCKGRSQHGFYGIEEQVVRAIAMFMLEK